MKTLAECHYGNTRNNVRVIYNTSCVKATIFDHIYDNFRPYIRQFSTTYTTIFDQDFSSHIQTRSLIPTDLFVFDKRVVGKKLHEKFLFSMNRIVFICQSPKQLIGLPVAWSGWYFDIIILFLIVLL